MKIKQKLAFIIGFIGITLIGIVAVNSQWLSKVMDSALELSTSDTAVTASYSTLATDLALYQEKQQLLIQLNSQYSHLPVLFAQAESQLITQQDFYEALSQGIGNLTLAWQALESLSASQQPGADFNYGFLKSPRYLVQNEMLALAQVKPNREGKSAETKEVSPSFYGALGTILVRINQDLQSIELSKKALLKQQREEVLLQQERTKLLAILGLFALALLSWITLTNLIHPLRALVNLATGLVSKDEKEPVREGAYKDYYSAVDRVGQYVEFQAGWQKEMKVTIAQYAKGQYAEVKMAQDGYQHPSYAPTSIVLPDEYFESMKVIEQLRGRLVNMHQEIQHLSNANLQREFDYRFSANDANP